MPAPAGWSGPIVSIVEEVRAGNAGLNAAIAAGDATAIASLYAEGARLLPDGEPRIDGRARIEDFFRAAVDAGFSNLRLATQEVVVASGDTAIEVGHWTSTAGPGGGGKYVLVWTRQSHDLKIEIDMFNSNSRPS